jgi:hypothetical protein
VFLDLCAKESLPESSVLQSAKTKPSAVASRVSEGFKKMVMDCVLLNSHALLLGIVVLF